MSLVASDPAGSKFNLSKQHGEDMHKNQQAAQLLIRAGRLSPFIGTRQRAALLELLAGEEGGHFADMMLKLWADIQAMPVTYEQDGAADPTVHLHYFGPGSCDAYITERDVAAEIHSAEPQHQAFGRACMNGESDLGYISLPEWLAGGAELDLYWKPKMLGECN